VFENWAYQAGFWADKAFFFITGINGVVPDQTFLGLNKRSTY